MDDVRSVSRPTRIARVLAAVVVSLALSSCWWSGRGYDADNTGHNPTETTITPQNINSLHPDWRRYPDTPSAPAVTPTGVVVSGFAGSNSYLWSFDPDTGVTRWQTKLRLSGAETSDVFVDPARGQALLSMWVGPDIQTWDKPATFDLTSGDEIAADPPNGTDPGNGKIVARRDGQTLTYSPAVEAPLCQGCREWGRSVSVPGHTLNGLIEWGAQQIPAGHEPTLGTTAVYAGTETASSGFAIASWDLDTVCSGTSGIDALPTCAPTWSTPVDGNATTVVRAGTTLYAATAAGTAYALDAATGAIRWSHPLGVGVDLTPAFDGKQLYLSATDGTLIVLDGETGAEVWRSQALAAPSTRPIVAGGIVFEGLSNGIIRGFIATCTQSCTDRNADWAAVQGTTPITSLAVDGGRLYATDDAGITSYAPAGS